MILPIVAYGHPVLRKVAQDIDENYPDLKKLLEDMWETMYASNGVGLAAPQINKDIRLFVIDSAQIFANMDEEERKDDKAKHMTTTLFDKKEVSKWRDI